MTAVGITENVKGDAKKFEIWYNAREEVYIIQVGPLTATQEPEQPLSVFRVADERLAVRTMSIVFTRFIPQKQELPYGDTGCARPRMEIRSKCRYNAKRTVTEMALASTSLSSPGEPRPHRLAL